MRLLEALGARCGEGARFATFDRNKEIPVFDEDLECDVPEAVTALWSVVARADLIFISTPEYNQSLPGGLKNLLDWITRAPGGNALEGKPCAVAGATVGNWGARIAQAQLASVLLSCGARVLRPRLCWANAASQGVSPDALNAFVLSCFHEFDCRTMNATGS